MDVVFILIAMVLIVASLSICGIVLVGIIDRRGDNRRRRGSRT